MKLLVNKINGLVLFVAGGILGAHAFEIPEVEQYWQQALAYYEQNTFVVLVIAGVALLVFGFYAILPKLPNRSERRAIRFSGEHGEVIIQLDSVQATLTKIMTNMPEIRKVDVRVDPDKKRERAIIKADVVLENQPDTDARQTANVVTSYIAETAIRMLGLEDLATVNLKIVGFHVNPKKASKAIRASRAAHALDRPVGRLTHVEVSDDAPLMFEETPAPDDAGLRGGPGSQALQTAGEMMAELEASDSGRGSIDTADDFQMRGGHTVTPDGSAVEEWSEGIGESAGGNDAPVSDSVAPEMVPLPPMAEDDAVTPDESDDLEPFVDLDDETTDPGVSFSDAETVDPGTTAEAEEEEEALSEQEAIRTPVEHEEEVAEDTDKKDKGGWGFV